MATFTDLTFDFHLNKSDNQVRNPFSLAIRLGTQIGLPLVGYVLSGASVLG